MHLLLALLTVSMLASSSETSPSEVTSSLKFEEEFNLLKVTIENMKKSEAGLMDRVENMERSEINLKKKMKESETDLKKKIVAMERSEVGLKKKMQTMEKKFEIKINNLEKKLAASMEYLSHNEEKQKVNIHDSTVISVKEENPIDKNAAQVDVDLTIKAGNNTEDRLEYLEELSKLNLRRSCHELSQYGVNKNSYYYVDPDGVLTGEAPVRVWCDFTQDGMAITEVTHNSEEEIDVEHCHDPGCYVRPILYSAPEFQIQSLIQLSENCEQSIEYNCLLAPLQTEGVNYGFWLDKNGEAQTYWDGSHSGEHVCSCYFTEEGCLEQETKNTRCNCDAAVPEMQSDVGTIRNMSALPVSQLHFGGLTYQIEQASHKLGRLRCWGQAQFEEGTSCAAIKKAGEFRSGYFNVKKTDDSNSRLVFCKSSPGYDENGEDEVFVESSEDHFQDVETTITEIQTDVTEMEEEIIGVGGQVSKLEDRVGDLMKRSDYCAYQSDWGNSGSVITYDKLVVSNNYNIPGAQMDISKGEFKAGVSGIYEVDVSLEMDSLKNSYNRVQLRHNGINIEESEMLSYIKTDAYSHEMVSRNMMVQLTTGDLLSVYADTVGSGLYKIMFCIQLAK